MRKKLNSLTEADHSSWILRRPTGEQKSDRLEWYYAVVPLVRVAH